MSSGFFQRRHLLNVIIHLIISPGVKIQGGDLQDKRRGIMEVRSQQKYREEVIKGVR